MASSMSKTCTSTKQLRHTAPYSKPPTGLVSRLPASWVPYAQLMRLDRPAGLYAFYFPYLIGTAYAACIAEEPPTPSALLRLVALLLPFNMVLRGIACTWNDNVDQDFDRAVERCRNRPIARGAVSTLQGHLFTAAQLLVLAAALYPFAAACIPHMTITVALFFVYALMKRVTYYPQVVLGLPFAWAIFFCKAALGMDAFAFRPGSTLCLVGANMLWTIVYDTIYAHQDVADDVKAGVKSMAVRFRHSTKRLASVLTIVQVALLVLCGLGGGFGPAYYFGTVGGVAASMSYFIYDVDLAKPVSCGQWFHDQFWIVGAAFMAGLCGEYVTRVAGTLL